MRRSKRMTLHEPGRRSEKTGVFPNFDDERLLAGLSDQSPRSLFPSTRCRRRVERQKLEIRSSADGAVLLRQEAIIRMHVGKAHQFQQEGLSLRLELTLRFVAQSEGQSSLIEQVCKPVVPNVGIVNLDYWSHGLLR